MRSTGEYVCQNDGRGPCQEEYVEDMRNLNIPDWAKFIRGNSLLLIIGLGILGGVLSIKEEDD